MKDSVTEAQATEIIRLLRVIATALMPIAVAAIDQHVPEPDVMRTLLVERIEGIDGVLKP
jgi:hypothetical protein